MSRTANASSEFRIGLVMQGGTEWIGGAQYIKNLAFALDALPVVYRARLRVCLLCAGSIDATELLELRHAVDELHIAWPSELSKRARVMRRLKHRLLHFDAFLRRLAGSAGVDFVYPYFPGRVAEHGFASAAWIADFQHRYLPELFSAEERGQRDRLFERVARWAPRIVVSSEVARKDALALYPECLERLRVLRFRTRLSTNWFDVEPGEVQRKYGLSDRFLLVCNQFWRHKNHGLVFRALRLLAARGVRPQVVCTGRVNDYRAPDYAKSLLDDVSRSEIAAQIHVLGLIPRSDQIQLMRRALAVVQPSRFEGWSTVVEDARALGKRLLLSDIDVHREQAPPGATYYGLDDAATLAEQMAEVWDVAHPGPDEGEAIARGRNAIDVAEFGASFLSIARDATSSTR